MRMSTKRNTVVTVLTLVSAVLVVGGIVIYFAPYAIPMGDLSALALIFNVSMPMLVVAFATSLAAVIVGRQLPRLRILRIILLVLSSIGVAIFVQTLIIALVQSASQS